MVYPVQPLEGGHLKDRMVKDTAKRIFGIWLLADDFANEMRRWQGVHLPNHLKFESNGVGELRLISAARWKGLGVDNENVRDVDRLSVGVIAKIAQLALLELAREVGIVKKP
jgi:hypothetical protein